MSLVISFFFSVTGLLSSQPKSCLEQQLSDETESADKDVPWLVLEITLTGKRGIIVSERQVSTDSQSQGELAQALPAAQDNDKVAANHYGEHTKMIVMMLENDDSED